MAKKQSPQTGSLYDATTAAGVQLSRDQRAAVEHDAGPLIVLAGPGTGKTRVIVHRVAHMINVRGIKPESIVAATFTVKAAEELRGRLSGLVGPVVAQRVRAGTLHGLGSSIVRRHADMLGLPSRLTMIDPAQSRRVLKAVIEDGKLFTAWRAEGLNALADRLIGMFDAMADRGVVPARAVEFAAEYERAAVGDAEKVSATMFADSARAYDAYCTRRWERGWLTYADFVLLPIMGLSGVGPVGKATSGMMRTLLRQEYTAFVVDEFQDCNAGQIEMLRLLAGQDAPDLCVVGDDDQAIYAFRGADERAFERFEKLWPKPRVVALTENHRSVPGIIGVSNAVIARAGASRFRADKTIEAVKPDVVGGGVTVVTLDHDDEDAEVIAAMILMERAKKAGGGAGAGVAPFSSFAVIARSHAHLDKIAGALTLEGIPWARKREASLLDDEGVKDVLAWIEWLVDPRATWCARRVMARPPHGIDVRTVTAWERAHATQAARARLDENAAVSPAPGPFHEWLAVQVKSSGEASAVGVRGVLELYEELRRETAGKRGDEAVDLIVRRTGAAHAELLPTRERARRISALVAVLGLARQKQGELDPPGDLAGFWSYFNELRDADPTMKDVRGADLLAEGNGADGEGAESGSDDDAAGIDSAEGRVQLLTGHAAKGLEFDTVFVARVRAPHGFPKTKVEEPEWTLPEGLTEEMDTRDLKTRRIEEERRLFYVACTRAERKLVLLGTHKGRRSSSINYLDELLLDKTDAVVTTVRGGEVLKHGAELGLGVLARSALEGVGQEFLHRQGAEEELGELTRQARLLAANALERAARDGVTQEELAACNAELERAARMLAVVARRGNGGGDSGSGEAPAWLVKSDAGLASLDARVRQLRTSAAAPVRTKLVLPPVPVPLELSFTSVDQYLRCPCCWYMRYMLRLPSPESDEVRIGNVVHRTLDSFMKAWAAADAEGAARPGLNDLLRIGRRVLVEELGRGGAAREEDARTLEAQLRMFHTRMHDDNVQVLETERSIEFPYEVDGVTHRFVAKIDRIDMVNAPAPGGGALGGMRVIDYKTGKGWNKLKEPAKDDLQLGIYALALRHSQGETGTLAGTAEYWLLATGERGVIALSALNEDKVRAKIDKVVRGITAGEFGRDQDCGGACELFGGG